MEERTKKIIKRVVIVVVIVVVALILFISFNPFGKVGAGERGIRLRWGAVVDGVVPEGLYVRIPIMERVVIMDVKIQRGEANAAAASVDLQTITSKVVLNFHIDPNQAANIYQSVGVDYKNRLINPAIQESVKSSTAKFTAEELITKRSEVREEIKIALREKLEPRGILVDDFSIVNFDFSKEFNAAIEKKVTAKEEALAAQNKLEQIKFEAEQEIAKAKGKAEAQRIEGQSLRENPAVLELRAIEKWNGTLPKITGGAIPFVQMPE